MKNTHRPRFGLQKSLVCLLTVIVIAFEVSAQIVDFPKDYQLYPRNIATNMANVKITGKVAQSTNYRRMVLQVYRDSRLIKTLSYNLNFFNKSANYTFNIEIPAELNNYRFSLYGANSWSQKHIRTVNNVVAGDSYIIQGQSNAVANLRAGLTTANNADDPSNSPNREFVRVYGSGSTSMSYTKAWFVGKGNVWYDVDGQVGQWGMRMGSNLVGSTNVPVAIFNGAMPGTPISYYMRNDNDPDATNTNYGRLLTRINEAGHKNNIRALIWFQGESDNIGVLSTTQLSTQQYKSAFRSLQTDWKSDYPGLKNFYIIQIRYGCGISTPDNCLKIQEAQRQLDNESDEILTLSSSNTNQIWENTGIEYCHYVFINGYKNIGDWLSPILQRDLHGVTMPQDIEAPQPLNAYFTSYNSSGAATQLAISLKDQQSAITLSGDLRSEFRLDNGNFSITSVTMANNIIYINFQPNSTTQNNPSFVSYRSHQGNAAPIITNSRGLGLIHFENFEIEPSSTPPPTTTICPDNYEPNNSSSSSKWAPRNMAIQASIGNSTDEDWYHFQTVAYGNLRLRLYNLPADYDLYLYTSTGQLLRSVTNTGMVNETIVYNDGAPYSNYLFRVVGKNGAFDPSSCYSLIIETALNPFANPTPPPSGTSSIAFGATAMETPQQAMEKNSKPVLYPNPASNYVTIEYNSSFSGLTSFELVDMNGRSLLVEQTVLTSGRVFYRLNLPNVAHGNYFIRIKNQNMILNRKLLIKN